MEPFRDREMDSSQRSLDSSQGGGAQQQGGSPVRRSPSHHPPGAALARPPSLGSVGGPGIPGVAPNLPSNTSGYGYHAQPLQAPPGRDQNQNQNQNQRLLQMQRQQQLRQLHQQRRHPTNQQSQNLSQLQQNYMQHLASDDRSGNAQRNNGPGLGMPAPPGRTNSAQQLQQQQQQTQYQSPSPSNASMPNGMPNSSFTINRANNNSSMTYAPPNPSGNASSAASSPTVKKSNIPHQGNPKGPPTSKPLSRSGVAPLPMSGNNRTHPNMPPPSSASTGATVNGSTTSIIPPSTALAPLPAVPDKEVPGLLSRCDWKDKTLWVSRHLLGGQALNGFSRSTANVQRIRRQRARQVKSTAAANSANSTTNKTDDGASISSTPSAAGTAASGKKREAPPDIESEEEMKGHILNARTAKKIKSEMDVGLKFCETMHEAIRGVLRDMGLPGVPVPAPLSRDLPMIPRATSRLPVAVAGVPKPPGVTKQSSRAMQMPVAPQLVPVVAPPTPAMPVPPVSQAPSHPDFSSPSTTAAGSAKNSMLKRLRKKKVPPSNDLNVGLSEFDANGKRLLSRKDYSQRVFEVVRFRALRNGDHVAARLSSRDLWILARVIKDYPSVKIPAVEFLQLSVVKRDGLFRDKVLLRDVEDKESGPNAVARSLVLPLPRNYSEAVEWGQHYRKGSRVYAMYPETTSLYTATVVDNVTYCQGDDDIIVVEFDGDEPDHTGSPPKCHIPARFVSFIPREFPAAQEKPARRQSSVSAQPVMQPLAKPAAPSAAATATFDDPLNSLDLSMDPFDDLDFDLGFN